MKLTDAEALEAATRLWRAKLKRNLAECSPREVMTAVCIVRELAAEIPGEPDPSSLRVFMLWMGDDEPAAVAQ